MREIFDVHAPGNVDQLVEGEVASQTGERTPFSLGHLHRAEIPGSGIP